MRINTNLPAQNSYRNLGMNLNKKSKSIGKLSTGHRINSAADDAAGLAISEKMRSQIRGLTQAARNVQDGLSLLQTADGALQDISDILQRMRELALQSDSGTQSADDRAILNLEYQELMKEIDNIADTTSFNGLKPLRGDLMPATQNAAWAAALCSPPIVSVILSDYNGPSTSFTPPASPSVSNALDAQSINVSLASTPAPVSTVSESVPSASGGTGASAASLTGVSHDPAIADVTTVSVPPQGLNGISAASGTVYIHANDFTPDASGNITLDAASGSKIVIVGNIVGNLQITGGEVKITGNVTGNLSVASGSSVEIQGGVSGAVSNDGVVIIGGSAGSVQNNSGASLSVNSVTNTAVNNGDMIISGNAGSVNNTGNMLVGGVSGAAVNSGDITITGNAGSVNNSGNMIAGSVSGLAENSSELKINGNAGSINNSSSGTMTVGGNVGSAVNNGDITINGKVSTITNNAKALLKNAAGANVTNSGDIELRGSTDDTWLNNLEGANARVSNGSGVTIVGNSANAKIESLVSNTNINSNNGEILVSAVNATVGCLNNYANVLVTEDNAHILVHSGTGTMEVRGNNSTIMNNYIGNVLMLGDNSTVHGNEGVMEVRGNNASVSNSAGGDMHITGNNAHVNTNSGDLYSNKALTGFTENTSTGKAYLVMNNLTVGTNAGAMYVEGSNTSVSANSGSLEIKGNSASVTSSTGDLRIIGDGAAVASTSGNAYVLGNNANVSNSGKLNVDGSDAHVTNNSPGEAIITGDRAIVTNRSGAQLRIDGEDAEVLNSGSAHIKGNGLEITNLSGADAKIDGDAAVVHDNAAGAVMKLTGKDSTITVNHGTMEIEGSNSVIGENHGGARLDDTTDAKFTINTGRIEVGAGSVITRIDNNTGAILVENGGVVNDTNGVNNGIIEVDTIGDVTLKTNNNTIISKGKTTLDTNAGYLEVGEWESTSSTGSAVGEASVKTNNGGVIRNYSQSLNVEKNLSGPESTIISTLCDCFEDTTEVNGGIIENYGTMNKNCINLDENGDIVGPLAVIHHHARDVDVSDICDDSGGTHTLNYTVNGESVSYTGDWKGFVAGGSQLLFDVTEVDNGFLIFDASDDLLVPGTVYAIKEQENVPNSSGTSGYQLIYLIPEAMNIQSGANQGDTTSMNLQSVNTEVLGGLGNAIVGCSCYLNETNINSPHAADCAIVVTSDALNMISEYRGKLGATYNRLEYKYTNLNSTAENLAAAESRIRDVDMAKEMTGLARGTILTQTATYMLAQANLSPQNVLQLLHV